MDGAAPVGYADLTNEGATRNSGLLRLNMFKNHFIPMNQLSRLNHLGSYVQHMLFGVLNIFSGGLEAKTHFREPLISLQPLAIPLKRRMRNTL